MIGNQFKDQTLNVLYIHLYYNDTRFFKEIFYIHVIVTTTYHHHIPCGYLHVSDEQNIKRTMKLILTFWEIEHH